MDLETPTQPRNGKNSNKLSEVLTNMLYYESPDMQKNFDNAVNYLYSLPFMKIFTIPIAFVTMQVISAMCQSSSVQKMIEFCYMLREHNIPLPGEKDCITQLLLYVMDRMRELGSGEDEKVFQRFFDIRNIYSKELINENDYKLVQLGKWMKNDNLEFLQAQIQLLRSANSSSSSNSNNKIQDFVTFIQQLSLKLWVTQIFLNMVTTLMEAYPSASKQLDNSNFVYELMSGGGRKRKGNKRSKQKGGGIIFFSILYWFFMFSFLLFQVELAIAAYDEFTKSIDYKPTVLTVEAFQSGIGVVNENMQAFLDSTKTNCEELLSTGKDRCTVFKASIQYANNTLIIIVPQVNSKIRKALYNDLIDFFNQNTNTQEFAKRIGVFRDFHDAVLTPEFVDTYLKNEKNTMAVQDYAVFSGFKPETVNQVESNIDASGNVDPYLEINKAFNQVWTKKFLNKNVTNPGFSDINEIDKVPGVDKTMIRTCMRNNRMETYAREYSNFFRRGLKIQKLDLVSPVGNLQRAAYEFSIRYYDYLTKSGILPEDARQSVYEVLKFFSRDSFSIQSGVCINKYETSAFVRVLKQITHYDTLLKPTYKLAIETPKEGGKKMKGGTLVDEQIMDTVGTIYFFLFNLYLWAMDVISKYPAFLTICLLDLVLTNWTLGLITKILKLISANPDSVNLDFLTLKPAAKRSALIGLSILDSFGLIPSAELHTGSAVVYFYQKIKAANQMINMGGKLLGYEDMETKTSLPYLFQQFALNPFVSYLNETRFNFLGSVVQAFVPTILYLLIVLRSLQIIKYDTSLLYNVGRMGTRYYFWYVYALVNLFKPEWSNKYGLELYPKEWFPRQGYWIEDKSDVEPGSSSAAATDTNNTPTDSSASNTPTTTPTESSASDTKTTPTPTTTPASTNQNMAATQVPKARNGGTDNKPSFWSKWSPFSSKQEEQPIIKEEQPITQEIQGTIWTEYRAPNKKYYWVNADGSEKLDTPPRYWDDIQNGVKIVFDENGNREWWTVPGNREVEQPTNWIVKYQYPEPFGPTISGRRSSTPPRAPPPPPPSTVNQEVVASGPGPEPGRRSKTPTRRRGGLSKKRITRKRHVRRVRRLTRKRSKRFSRRRS